MISEEKMTHVLHLMLKGLKTAGYADFPNEEVAIREGRLACNKFITAMAGVAEAARKRILSMKNPPVEHSTQWETLYQKYYEEEMAKLGGNTER